MTLPIFSVNFHNSLLYVMKQFITLTTFIFLSNYSSGQFTSTNEFNDERVKITKQSLAILGGWGGANLIYSGIALGSATGSDTYFHQMNLIWGGVNFAIGTLSFLFTKNKEEPSYSQSIKKQMTIEKIYLFNTGLDVAYMAGGLYFREKANNNTAKHDRYRGYGKSIILQGSALFLFDGIMYIIHQKHGMKLYKLADNIKIGAAFNGLGFIVKF